MGFHDLITLAGAAGMAKFSNCTVSVRLSGVEVDSFRAMFDHPPRAVSVFDGAVETGRPSVTAPLADVVYLDGSYTLVVTIDGETTETEYQISGAPAPDGLGMCLLNLTKD